jgi:hypothetical protein
MQTDVIPLYMFNLCVFCEEHTITKSNLIQQLKLKFRPLHFIEIKMVMFEYDLSLSMGSMKFCNLDLDF